METPSLRPFLQNLCRNSPWDYAIFWKVQHEPHMLLTWEDGYYAATEPKACMPGIKADGCTGSLNEFLSSICGPGLRGPIAPGAADMSTTYYTLGKGIVAEVASEGVARWFFPGQIENDGVNATLISQCPEEWLPQFAAGIKTILVIPYMPVGVLQLGSFETIPEDAQLVDDISNEFAAKYNFAGCSLSFWLSVANKHQLSVMMSAPADITGDSSASIGGITSENPRTEEDLLSYANTSGILPISCHLVGSHMPEVQESETKCKEDTQFTNLTNVVTPANHQLFEQHKPGMMNVIERSLNLHEIGDLSGFDRDATSGNYTDEMINFYHEGGVPFSVNRENVMYQGTNELLGFPGDFELHKELGPGNMDTKIQYTHSFSSPFEVVARSSVYNADINQCAEPISCDSDRFVLRSNDGRNLLEAAVAEPSRSLRYNYPYVHIDSDSFYPRKRFIPEFNGQSHSGRIDMVAQHPGPWSSVMLADSSLLTLSSPSTTSYTHQVRVSTVDQPQGKTHNFLHHRKRSNLSTTKKRRPRPGHHQNKPRPRDRQLIQDRIKELRALVPSGEKCSIDALLDKTIKHMAFLQSITDRADKLGRRVAKEETSKSLRPRPSEVRNGASWALDLASEKQMFPVTVKDLAVPGQILIEMECDDYGRFLQISGLIHRLELTILQGVMDKRSDNATWAHFVVEASGNFQRLDLFWPLMQLLQQNKLEIQEGSVCNPSWWPTM